MSGSGRSSISLGASLRETPRREMREVSASASSVDAGKQQAADQRIVELACRFRAGEEAAFDELAPLAGRIAYHLALRSVADTNLAEEIAQEALIRIYRHIGEIADAGAFKTWFY
ncbi:MAG: sigma factor, partial [Planctomycetota bacterium]